MVAVVVVVVCVVDLEHSVATSAEDSLADLKGATVKV